MTRDGTKKRQERRKNNVLVCYGVSYSCMFTLPTKAVYALGFRLSAYVLAARRLLDIA